MTRIAITGIGGFIGLRMAERARDMGWDVTGVDLSPAGVARATAAGARAIQGDITDPVALADVFEGAHFVFHTAAVVQEDGPRELYERVNNVGTRIVCEVAKAKGVKRVLHLSSIMVYGFDYPDQVTEEGPFASNDNIYNETKLSSERIALSFNDSANGFGVVAIRPGDVYGMGSVPWVMRPLDIIRKGQFMLPDGGRGVINHVHVDNLIDGVLLAAASDDAPGQAFNITDDMATPCHEYFGHLALMAGQRRVRTAPFWLMSNALRAGELILTPLGIHLPVQRAGLRFLNRRHKISIAKARRMLGYSPAISLSQGMQQLAHALRAADVKRAN